MSYEGPKAFRRAVEEFAKLPGIGEKTAQRLVFHLIHADPNFVKGFSGVLQDLKEKLKLCSTCCGLTEEDPCPLCCDSRRDHGLICVVEDPSHLFVIERSGQYRGVYHVLHGSLAPLDGIGPEELMVAQLLRRIAAAPPREVILATNPDVEGEATAAYLAKRLGAKGIRTTRIAMGIPMGGHLEYTDQVTIGRAIAERREYATP